MRLIKPPRPAPGAAAVAAADARPGRRPAAPRRSRPACSAPLPGGGTITPLLPGGSLDLDGDGKPDAGLSILPLEDAEFDLDTNTGTIKLGGGLDHRPARRSAPRSRSSTREVVIGATPDASGLFAHINGVRVKVGDIDTDTLDLDVARRHRHDQAASHVTVSGARRAAAATRSSARALIQAGTPLLSLDLSFPS